MEIKTEAIVLAIQKNSDTTSIVHLFTQEFGRMPFLVYGRKGASSKKKNGISLNIFTPLSQMEITFQLNPAKPISVIQSAALTYVPANLVTDIKRQCISLFISESLIKTIVHPMKDEQLYSFLKGIIKELDLSDSIEDIPNRFLTHLSLILGYGGEPMEELLKMNTFELIKDFIML